MPQISRTLLFLALAAGVAVAPSMLSAQAAPEPVKSEAAAQTAHPATEAAASEKKADEKKSDEEQAEVFRLEGPIVKWTAKTFHLQNTTVASIFEFLNFGIVVLALGIPLIKFLPKILKGRGEKVRADIESARKATDEANARLSAIETKLAGLDEEIRVIRVQVETESRQDMERIHATIAEESARIVASAEQEIGSSAAQARRSLRNFAADLAIEQAAKQLVVTPETDRALIAEFLGDAALSGKAKGGLN
jgi:F-type H+-transporting ATPase subunit b